MAKQLANVLVSSGIVVESDLCPKVRELVRRELNSEMSQNGFLDSDPQGTTGSRNTLARDEQSVRDFADDWGRDFVTKEIKTIRQDRRKLELECILVFRLFAVEHKDGRFAAPLRPVDVLVETQFR